MQLLMMLTVASFPALESIDPAHASTAGGAVIRLLGAGFVAGTRAAIVRGAESVDLSCRIRSTNLMECEVPAGSAGPVDVVVTNRKRAGDIVVEGLVYFEIRAVRPDHGPAEGGTRVVVTGEHFPRTTRILFGGAPGACTWKNESEIRCTTPPGPANELVHVDALPPDEGQTPSRKVRGYFYDGVPWAPPGVARAPLTRLLPQPLTLAATRGARRIEETPPPPLPPPSPPRTRRLRYEFDSIFAPTEEAIRRDPR